jgi:hypothetical protein
MWVLDLRAVRPILSNRRANLDSSHYTYGINQKYKAYQWDTDFYEHQQRKDSKACVRTVGKKKRACMPKL